MDRSTYDVYLFGMEHIAEESQTDASNGIQEADRLLCEFLAELGYHELVEVYQKVERPYQIYQKGRCK